MGAGEFAHQINEMKAYWHYYKTGSSKELAPGMFSGVLSDSYRRAASQDMALNIRRRAVAGNAQADEAWKALHMVGRMQFGKNYSYQGDEWQRGWADGTYKPIGAMDYEYNRGDYVGGQPYHRDIFERGRRLTTLEKLRNAFQGTRYVSPREGSDWLYIPEEPVEEDEDRPQLQEGGIVLPSPGGTDITVGEGGKAEAIIPLDQLPGNVGY